MLHSYVTAVVALLVVVFLGISTTTLVEGYLLVPSSPLLSPLKSLSSSSRPTTCCRLMKNSKTGDAEDDDNVCGSGFYKQTGPDGDYCVFDYDALHEEVVAEEKSEAAEKATEPEPSSEVVAALGAVQVPADEHYFDALESQNKARMKFGLKPLTPDQYIALQAQNHLIAKKQIEDATSTIFREFDKNNDGVITLQELQEGLISKRIGSGCKKQIEKLFNHYDANNDGVLQLEEFVTLDTLRKQLELIAVEEEKMISQSQTTTSRTTTTTNNNNNVFQNFMMNMFQDTCQSNYDCDYPEVCCDFGYKKTCCNSGEITKQVKLEYATVPVPQNI